MRVQGIEFGPVAQGRAFEVEGAAVGGDEAGDIGL